MRFTATQIRNERDAALARAKVKADKNEDQHILWSRMIDILAEDVLRYKQKAELFEDYAKGYRAELEDARTDEQPDKRYRTEAGMKEKEKSNENPAS
jgi:hypothetical protein